MIINSKKNSDGSMGLDFQLKREYFRERYNNKDV